MDSIDELQFSENTVPPSPGESETESVQPTTPEFVTSQSLFSLNKSEDFGTDVVPKFTRNIIICILSECMNELSILRSINLQNDLGPNSDKLVSYVSIEGRYMGQENHADYRINSTNNNFDKIAKDINRLYVILKETCRELKKYGRYKVLEDAVTIINQMHKEEEQLLEDEAKQERVIEEVKNRCEEERLENIRTIEETDSKIQQLRFQVEDIYIYGQHEVQYFDKWEKTRMEQNVMKCRGKENEYETIIKDTQEKIKIETRCHSEVEAYFEEIRNDYLDGIQHWMKTYDDEIEQREGDLIHLKADLDRITDERKNNLEKYERRQAEINDWLEYKRIKEERELQRQKEIYAATKIQAWWRGVMVRKKLGPYRKKKKGKGKGKDKDKKKGKKK